MDFCIGGGISVFVTEYFSAALLKLDKWNGIAADLQTSGETDYHLCLFQVTYLLLCGLLELKIYSSHTLL